MSDRPDLVEFRHQQYDFACGELTSRFRFHAATAIADIEVLTLCSRTHPTIILQEVRMIMSEQSEVGLISRLETKGVDGRCRKRVAPRAGCDGVVFWEANGGVSICGGAYQ